MTVFLRQQWFLISLVLAFAVGFGLAGTLKPITDLQLLRQLVVATVMFLMSLSLETTVIVKAIRRPWSAFLASAINLGFLPLVAPLFGLLLDSRFAAGLMVVAATPCTLAAAAVWTRRAGGNDTVALMTTVITNAVCFVVTPLWVWYLLGDQNLELDLDDLIRRLFLLVLLPMFLAQIARRWKGIAQWSTNHKRALGTIAQFGILYMVVIGAVHTAELLGDSPVSGASILLIVVVCTIMHLLTWLVGFVAARQMGFPLDQQIAVSFSASQKTLMVGLVICLQVGVSVLPMVVYHAVQLIADTLIADRLARAQKA